MTDEGRRRLFDDWAADYDTSMGKSQGTPSLAAGGNGHASLLAIEPVPARLFPYESPLGTAGYKFAKQSRFHFEAPALAPGRFTSGNDDSFPFAGYEAVLDEIVRQAGAGPGMTVLDLGTGTGQLAARFAALGCALWATDFSAAMLEKAHARLPGAVLVQADLLGEWPAALERRFDRIVSAYVLHEFDLDTKVGLLRRLAGELLEPGGRIVIGDVAFPSAALRERAHQRWADCWDEDEHYWAADEAVKALGEAGLETRYTQISICGGVFVCFGQP